MYISSKSTLEYIPLIYFESPYLNFTAPNYQIYRDYDCYVFTDGPLKAVFSGKYRNSILTILGLSAYIWYFILIFFIIYWIKQHIEKQVIIPFNSLFEKIWLMIIDPMMVVSNVAQVRKIAGIYSLAKV